MSVRIHPYISEMNQARLKALAARPRQNESRIVNTALDAYFASSPDGIAGHAILRRLDRLTRQFDRLEQKDLVLGETLALFIIDYVQLDESDLFASAALDQLHVPVRAETDGSPADA